jgi:hypothetical protein
MNALKLKTYPSEYFSFIRKVDLKNDSRVDHLLDEKYSLPVGTKFRNSLNRYVELHHILPIFEGSVLETANFVVLTPYHHLIAHLILAEKLGGKHWFAADAVTKGNDLVSDYRSNDKDYCNLVKAYKEKIKYNIKQYKPNYEAI